mgnify:FL=1
MQTKEQKISPIKQRILYFAGTLGISKRDFYSKIGVSRGTLESNTGITEDVMAKFIAIYPNINPEWLLTGEGNMTKPINETNNKQCNPQSKETFPPEAIPIAKNPDCDIKPIPLVLPKVAAGFGGASFSISKEDVKEYYVVPKFKHCNVDFMIEVTGLSMYPHFNPGDVIACSILHNSQFIQWNKCHVIATREQGILVKRIMPGDDKNHLQAVSDNKDYPPFEIPVEEITGIALVIGSISLE